MKQTDESIVQVSVSSLRSLGVVSNPDYSGMLPSDVAECCHFCGGGLYQLFTSIRIDRGRGSTGYSTT